MVKGRCPEGHEDEERERKGRGDDLQASGNDNCSNDQSTQKKEFFRMCWVFLTGFPCGQHSTALTR